MSAGKNGKSVAKVTFYARACKNKDFAFFCSREKLFPKRKFITNNKAKNRSDESNVGDPAGGLEANCLRASASTLAVIEKEKYVPPIPPKANPSHGILDKLRSFPERTAKFKRKMKTLSENEGKSPVIQLQLCLTSTTFNLSEGKTTVEGTPSSALESDLFSSMMRWDGC